MPRGGARPGSGRKRKESKEPIFKAKDIPTDIRKAARAFKLSPLDYMLMVVNDENAALERRDRLAQAAAPYCHPRKEPVGQGIKEQKAEEAKETGVGKFATPPAPPRLVANNA